MRAAAAAATAPLGAGVYLSYSRGAIAVAVLGLVHARRRARRSAPSCKRRATAFAAGAAASVAAAAFPGVAALEGTAPRARRRRRARAARAGRRRRPRCSRVRPTPRPTARCHAPRRLAPVAGALVAAFAAGLVIAGLGERPSDDELAAGAGAAASRPSARTATSTGASALDAFAREPLTGIGAGGFRVEWLRERPLPEAVRDAHSLEVEVAAELGLPGPDRARAASSAASSRPALAALRRAPRARRRTCRRAARVVPARVDRLGLAAARPSRCPRSRLAGALIVLADEGPAFEAGAGVSDSR